MVEEKRVQRVSVVSFGSSCEANTVDGAAEARGRRYHVGCDVVKDGDVLINARECGVEKGSDSSA